MTSLDRIGLLSGILGLFVSLAPLALGQQGNASSTNLGTTNAQATRQESPAYQSGYQQGLKDGAVSREPSPAVSAREDAADRRAYTAGYHAGYCREEEKRTGYYNGVYGYGPPVIRNGYYGYNAPEPYCVNGGKSDPQGAGDSRAPQNVVEYAGGG